MIIVNITWLVELLALFADPNSLVLVSVQHSISSSHPPPLFSTLDFVASRFSFTGRGSPAVFALVLRLEVEAAAA